MKPTVRKRKNFRENLRQKVRDRIEAEEFRQELRDITNDYHAAVAHINKKFPQWTVSLRDML